jgi:hypothetical protein
MARDDELTRQATAISGRHLVAAHCADTDNTWTVGD